MSAQTHPIQPQQPRPELVLSRPLLTILTTRTKRIPRHFNYFRTPLRKRRDGTPERLLRLFNIELFNLPSCKFFRIRTYSQTPRFAAFWPKSSARKSFRISTYKIWLCNPFRIRTYEETRGVGDIMLTTFPGAPTLLHPAGSAG